VFRLGFEKDFDPGRRAYLSSDFRDQPAVLIVTDAARAAVNDIAFGIESAEVQARGHVAGGDLEFNTKCTKHPRPTW